MAISLASIKKETSVRAPRIVLIGCEKIGKTTFACGSRFEDGVLVETGLNSPVVIPMKGEEGADSLDVAKFPTVDTYDDLIGSLKALAEEDHEYKAAVLDSASALHPLIIDDVCAEFTVRNIRKVPGFRTGEAAVMNRWRRILDTLDYLRNEKNMMSILIGHAKVRKFKNPEGDDFDQYELDVEHADIGELIKRWADLILFANTKVVVKIEGEDHGVVRAKRRGQDSYQGQRFLFTQKKPAHPGGGRGVYGRLPYELPLDWAAFENAVAAAL